MERTLVATQKFPTVVYLASKRRKIPMMPSPERTKVLQKIMVAGNKPAKRIASDYQVNNRVLRQFLAGRPIYREIDQERLQRLRISKKDKTAILAVEEIRNEVVERFIPLVESVSNRIGSQFKFDSSILKSEGILHLIDLIYGYDRANIKFITYAQTGLYLELRRYVFMERNDGIPSHSSSALKLISDYYEAKRNLTARGIQPSFEQIFDWLGLKPTEKNAIEMRHIMAKVHGFSESFDCPEDRAIFSVEDRDTLEHLFRKAELTEYEKDLIRSDLNGESTDVVAYEYGQSFCDAPKVLKMAVKKLQAFVKKNQYRIAA